MKGNVRILDSMRHRLARQVVTTDSTPGETPMRTGPVDRKESQEITRLVDAVWIFVDSDYEFFSFFTNLWIWLGINTQGSNRLDLSRGRGPAGKRCACSLVPSNAFVFIRH